MLWREGKQRGKAVRGWGGFPAVFPQALGFPGGRGAAKREKTGRKEVSIWAPPQHAIPVRAGLPLSVSSARLCVCEGEDTEQGRPWTCECYVGSPLATRNPEAMGY